MMRYGELYRILKNMSAEELSQPVRVLTPTGNFVTVDEVVQADISVADAVPVGENYFTSK